MPRNPVRESSVKQRRRVESQRKARQMRMYAMIAGVVVIAIIAVVALILANKPPAEVGTIATVAPKTWPEADGKALGPANASVVLKEFADYQCPICKEFNASVQQQIIDTYVKTGKVRYEFHNFIIIDGNVGGTESRNAAEAAECANEQGKFWDYHEILFANQGAEGSGALNDTRLKAFAASIGLDTAKFNACFGAKRYATNVTTDDAMARSLGLNGTPSLLVNGKLVSNPLDFTTVKAAIDAALNGQ